MQLKQVAVTGQKLQVNIFVTCELEEIHMNLYWTYDIVSPLNCYLNDIPSLYELSYKMSQHEHYFGLELKISYLKFQSRQMLKQ